MQSNHAIATFSSSNLSSSFSKQKVNPKNLAATAARQKNEIERDLCCCCFCSALEKNYKKNSKRERLAFIFLSLKCLWCVKQQNESSLLVLLFNLFSLPVHTTQTPLKECVQHPTWRSNHNDEIYIWPIYNVPNHHHPPATHTLMTD
jgi:hypothetical protein